ncbi:MAG: poly(R)-hydroxyalkanoic acid synthase subunit PhaE [Gammaproteobacteria bacterium]
MEDNTNPFFSPEWLELQRRYLESFTAKPGGHDSPEREEWQRALDQWWASVRPLIPEESKPVFDSILGRSRGFYSLSTQFSEMLREIAGAADAGEEWQSILHRHIKRMKTRFDESAGGDNSPTSFSDAWEQAFVPIPPDELFGGQLGDDLQQFNDRLLSLPGIGPFREEYEKVRESMRLWQAGQEKCREYRDVLSRLGKEALDRLEEKILQMGRKNRSINSLREFYDIWSESNEEVFSKYVESEEYSILYGEMISLLMEFRGQSRAVLQDFYKQLDIPAGREMKNILDSQQVLQDALRHNEKEQQELRSTIEDLRRELKQLRDDMDALGDEDKGSRRGKRS